MLLHYFYAKQSKSSPLGDWTSDNLYPCESAVVPVSVSHTVSLAALGVYGRQRAAKEGSGTAAQNLSLWRVCPQSKFPANFAKHFARILMAQY